MLGLLLAFNAGAVNAGGFLVLHMYTSHMTGNITDVGIELGKMLYMNGRAVSVQSHVRHNRYRLRAAGGLACAFVLGGHRRCPGLHAHRLRVRGAACRVAAGAVDPAASQGLATHQGCMGWTAGPPAFLNQIRGSVTNASTDAGRRYVVLRTRSRATSRPSSWRNEGVAL